MPSAVHSRTSGLRYGAAIRRAAAIGGFIGALATQAALLACCYALLEPSERASMPFAVIFIGAGTGLALMILARCVAREQPAPGGSGAPSNVIDLKAAAVPAERGVA